MGRRGQPGDGRLVDESKASLGAGCAPFDHEEKKSNRKYRKCSSVVGCHWAGRGPLDGAGPGF